jgi:hypothetical protein
LPPERFQLLSALAALERLRLALETMAGTPRSTDSPPREGVVADMAQRPQAALVALVAAAGVQPTKERELQVRATAVALALQ